MSRFIFGILFSSILGCVVDDRPDADELDCRNEVRSCSQGFACKQNTARRYECLPETNGNGEQTGDTGQGGNGGQASDGGQAGTEVQGGGVGQAGHRGQGDTTREGGESSQGGYGGDAAEGGEGGYPGQSGNAGQGGTVVEGGIAGESGNEAGDGSAGEGSDVPVGLPSDQGIHIKLTWDQDMTDLDLHFAHPNAEHWFEPVWDCHWMYPAPDWSQSGNADDNPVLLIDDTDGLGPEETALINPKADIGNYRVGVHYYRSPIQSRNNRTPIVATVTLTVNGTDVQTFSRELRDGQMWRVADIEWLSTQEARVVEFEAEDELIVCDVPPMNMEPQCPIDP